MCRGSRGVVRRLEAEASELGVDAAGEDEGEHAEVAEERPDGVAERGWPVALHEEVAVPRHTVTQDGRGEEWRGAAGDGREERAGERGERAEEVPPPGAGLGVLGQVEPPELLHATEPMARRRLLLAPPHRVLVAWFWLRLRRRVTIGEDGAQIEGDCWLTRTRARQHDDVHEDLCWDINPRLIGFAEASGVNMGSKRNQR